MALSFIPLGTPQHKGQYSALLWLLICLSSLQSHYIVADSEITELVINFSYNIADGVYNRGLSASLQGAKKWFRVRQPSKVCAFAGHDFPLQNFQ